MYYYQILKKRRLDLNLSIQDIAIQTHLAPEFIRAIEENNLDVFAQDLSYVRYFVRAYSEAIGVNWQVIAGDVDNNVEIYARARDQALTQAQMLMAAQMTQAKAAAPQPKRKNRKKAAQPAKKKSSQKKTVQKGKTSASRAASSSQLKKAKAKPAPKRRKIGFFRGSAMALSRMLNWKGRDGITKLAIVGTISAILVMSAASYVIDTINARDLEAAREERRQELLEKEQETQKLADQLQSQKQQDAAEKGMAPIVTASKKTNTFYVTNVLGVSDEVKLSVDSENPLEITVKEGEGKEAKELFKQTVETFYSKTLKVSQEMTITIACKNYTSADTFKISGSALPLNNSGFSQGEGTITIHFVYYVPAEEDKPLSAQNKQEEEKEEKEETTQAATEETSTVQSDAFGNVIPEGKKIINYDVYGNPVYGSDTWIQGIDLYGNATWTDPATGIVYDAMGNPSAPAAAGTEYDVYGNPITVDSAQYDIYGNSAGSTDTVQYDIYGNPLNMD